MNEEILKTVVFWGIEIFLCCILGILLYKIYNIKRIRENSMLKDQAYTDPLTKRGNRHLFLKVMDDIIKKGKKFAVCFMDLDGFKQINDTMGHDAGDELLIYLSKTFEEKLPKNAVAYRLGGDEFAIIIEDVKTTRDITTVLDNLKNELKVPIIIENTSISLEYSLGIAIYPEDADNRQDLIAYADDAMYYIKENGKNNYYFHNKVLKAKLDNKNKMEKDLKEAYLKKQFRVAFQPRINLKEKDRLCFEALLYWEHPILGKLDSEYFIKQAEDMALTIKIDHFVLDLVCKKICEIKESYPKVRIAMNISNRHVSRKDFVDILCNIINSYSINKGELCIEIVDSIDTRKVENYKIMFERLRECGVEIGINNLETKYSSLSLFTKLNISEMKLSCKYLDIFSEEVFKDIINIGKNLNYKMVVSNIENKEEYDRAIMYGADIIQGNYICKKIEYDGIEEYKKEYIDNMKN